MQTQQSEPRIKQYSRNLPERGFLFSKTQYISVLMKRAVKAEVNAESLSQVKPIGPGGSEGSWRALTSLLQSTHSDVDTYTYKLTSYTHRLSFDHPSFQRAARPAANKFSFPLGWDEALLFAPLPLSQHEQRLITSRIKEPSEIGETHQWQRLQLRLRLHINDSRRVSGIPRMGSGCSCVEGNEKWKHLKRLLTHGIVVNKSQCIEYWMETQNWIKKSWFFWW